MSHLSDGAGDDPTESRLGQLEVVVGCHRVVEEHRINRSGLNEEVFTHVHQGADVQLSTHRHHHPHRRQLQLDVSGVQKVDDVSNYVTWVVGHVDGDRRLGLGEVHVLLLEEGGQGGAPGRHDELGFELHACN